VREPESSIQGRLSPFVSILMPVRNEAAFIKRSLGAVVSQDYPADRFEVLVADGRSTDDTRAIIAGLNNKSVKIIDNPGGIVATGLNAALQHARGEIIVRVDGHCEIAPDYVSRCVHHLLAHRLEAVGGSVETIGESYSARVIAAAMSSPFGVGGSAFRIAGSRTQFTDTVPFPAYTRAVINRAGDFDEELVRNQDDEYNYRLRKLGVKILLAADVRSRYYSRATFTRLFSQYFQYGFWKVRVMQKHPLQMRWRQLMPSLFIALMLFASMLAIRLTPVSYAVAAALAAYLLASFAGAVLSARQNGWALLPALPLAFGILHLAYGLGFLTGLLRFCNRWGQRQECPVVAAAMSQNQQI
jgi:succinoglycan biosynthesis protein ExoA